VFNPTEQFILSPFERLTRQKEHDTESENETTRQEGVRSCPECDFNDAHEKFEWGNEISCEDCGLILEEARSIPARMAGVQRG